MNDYIFYAPYVPENWKIIPNKYVFIPHSKKVGKDFRNYNLLSLTKNGVILKDIESNEGKLPASFEGYQTVERNDLILCLFDLDVSAVFSGLSEYQGMITSAYDVYQVNTQLMIPKFADYWFANVFSERSYSVYSKSLRHTIAYDSFKNIPIAVPSLGTQSKIVSFLSEKIKTIDSLISNETKQIEKLEEYKKAVITKAVTKGLDPNAKMKDSGVKWIGEIPENWSTIRIKNVSWLKGRIGWDGLKSSEFIDSGPYLITGTDFSNGSIDWKTCAHISEERYLQDELLHIKENDLLITKDGTIGKLAIVKNCPEKVSLNSGVMIIRNDTAFKYSNRYLYYVLQSNQFFLWYELSQSGSSTIKHLYQAQFYNFEFSYPSLNEQSNIANYLDEKCSKIGLLLDSFEQKISKLKAYKQSLIYEYVTGKKRVSL